MKTISRSVAPLKLSWRVGLWHSKSEAAFAQVRELLLANREVVQEVAFFETLSHHLYLPMEFVRESAEVLGRRMATLRADGIRSVGINVLTTIGHLNEGWDIFPALPFPRMVGHDGATTPSCACPRSPAMQRYVAEKYTLFAREKPDFIWVDDDVRMQGHGIEYGCFCADCVARVSRAVGTRYTRETLVRALSRPAGGRLRRAWVAQNAAGLNALMRVVERSVHRVAPRVELGLMTSNVLWNSYGGADIGGMLKALRARKMRPGGGFYTDETPGDMVNKALEMGRQELLRPASVPEVQYELENFPYTTLGKSRQALIAECTLALAMGCNGVAFNMLGMGPLNAASTRERRPMMRAIGGARAFWAELVEAAGDHAVSGYWPAYHPQLAARREVRPGEDWLGWNAFLELRRPNALARLGLPLCPGQEGGGVILCGRHAETFTTPELRAMLAGPVLMDAFALEILTTRGLGELAGARVTGWQDNGLCERLTEDPLNGAMAGGCRDIRSEFWGDPYLTSATLEPLAPGVRVLSVLETYLGERRGPCVTAYENRLGGRVVVFGHAPWRYVDVKRQPVLDAADWAMRGRVPVRIGAAVPMVPVVRLSPDRRRGVIVLLNAGLDPVRGLEVEVRAPRTRVRCMTPGRKSVALKPVPVAGRGGWKVRLPLMAPWQVVALRMG